MRSLLNQWRSRLDLDLYDGSGNVQSGIDRKILPDQDLDVFDFVSAESGFADHHAVVARRNQRTGGKQAGFIRGQGTIDALARI